MKANHNLYPVLGRALLGCFQYDKDSKMKANHNTVLQTQRAAGVVSSTTKIVKWKQITTGSEKVNPLRRCFQYDKDSKMKANHNKDIRINN